MKKGILLLLCLLIVVGCSSVKERNREDIVSYLESTIGIKGYDLANEAKEIEGNDGLVDYYWQVKYKDIEFNVIDDYHIIDSLGAKKTQNDLTSNFNQEVFDYYYSIYGDINSITYKTDYIYGKKTLICEVADEQKNINNDKLEQCYNNIVNFINTFDFTTYPLKVITVEITNSTGHVYWYKIYDKRVLTFSEFKNN